MGKTKRQNIGIKNFPFRRKLHIVRPVCLSAKTNAKIICDQIVRIWFKVRRPGEIQKKNEWRSHHDRLPRICITNPNNSQLVSVHAKRYLYICV